MFRVTRWETDPTVVLEELGTLDGAIYRARKWSARLGETVRVLDGAVHRAEARAGKARWLVPCVMCRGTGMNYHGDFQCNACFGSQVQPDTTWKGAIIT